MMNDKIRSLAEKSGIEIKPMIIDDIEYEYEFVEMDGFDDLKKFAELIIKESITVMTQHDYHGEWLGEKIKEHFGIEE